MLLLRIGDEGEPVAAIEQALADDGAVLAIDGIFDQETENAVRVFQAAKSLHVDGIVGNDTIRAMGLDWPTLDPSGFRAEVVRIAGAEWRRWHPGGTKLVETDPTMTSVLQDYYATGIGKHVDAADLQDSDWQAEHFWSAVFISWVMRQAGAGSRFRYAASHQRYIAAAKANREAGDVNNPFWAFRLDELPPEVGDLVGAGRGNSGATYANIAEGHFDCHVDIVTAVSGTDLTVIGGNVGQSVGRTTVQTSHGFVDTTAPDQDEYFAVIRIQDF